MVVEPVGRTRTAVQPGNMSAEPDTGISKVVGVACLRVRTMLIDRRRPVNGDAAHYQAREKQNVQPMAHSYQQVVFAGKTDARLRGSSESAHIIGLGLGSHRYNLQSSILGLGCRGGNHENAAGGHGVSD